MIRTALTFFLLAAAGTSTAFDVGSSGRHGDLILRTPPLNANTHSMIDDGVSRVYCWPFGFETLQDGRVVGFGALTAQGWFLEGANNPPLERPLVQMGYDYLRGSVIIPPGPSFQGQQSTTFVYQSGVWNSLLTNTVPRLTSGMATAWDPVGERVIIFGGADPSGSEVSSLMYAFTGQDWVLVQTTDEPPPRRGAQMVTDWANNRVLLYGGTAAFNHINDLWAFDGQAWTEIETSNRPPAINQPRIAYDRDREIVVFHGHTGNPTDPYDGATWVFDGDDWQRIETTNKPVGMMQHAMAWDPIRRGVVATGGFGPVFSRDTWLFTGSDWIRPIDIQQQEIILQLEGEHLSGVWELNSILVEEDVTLSFQDARQQPTPIRLLVKGDVRVDGTIDISGRRAQLSGIDITAPEPNPVGRPGPGGYPGALGGRRTSTPGETTAANAGIGPAGGQGVPQGTIAGSSGGQLTPLTPHGFMGWPLVGGSSGGAGLGNSNSPGNSSAGGGGAILIAAEGNIVVNGAIRANGLQGNDAFPFGFPRAHSGPGMVRLVASQILGRGSIEAVTPDFFPTPQGVVRLEADFIQDGPGRLTVMGNKIKAPRVAVEPPNPPEIRIVSVGGVAVSGLPSGDPATPDIVLDQAGAVEVVIATENIPTGTILRLRLNGEGPAETVDSTPINSQGMCSVEIPSLPEAGLLLVYGLIAP